MKRSRRKSTPKASLGLVTFRPYLENLEDRLVPGDTILSGLLGQAVLHRPSHVLNINIVWGGV